MFVFIFSVFSGNQGLNCQVLVDNGQGSSLVLQLPCDAQTAVFITQLSKALYQLSKWYGLVYPDSGALAVVL